ncbi:hypothetical protein OAB57_01265 [Bacteriovoracaceae bacterium]|nr:hypothetical protein [Bacteriovoracaceae bacterium]
MKWNIIILSLLLLSGCSSNKKVTEREHEEIQRSYIVRDSNYNVRPIWVSDAVSWAQDRGNLKKFRYFSFETTPKVDREIACELAKTNARSDIASEIASFIEKEVGMSKEGDASIDENNPQMVKLKEYVSMTLAEKTKALIHGAQVAKTYWEKRSYKEKLGAKRDFVGYSCSALIKIGSKRLRNAVDKAANFVINNVDDTVTKNNVKSALKNVSENFDKAKKGML